MPAALPPGLVAYRRTPVFDQIGIPAGLRRAHSTKLGVWALIHVLGGRLAYRTFDPDENQVLTPGVPGVIRPEQRHEVEPLGAVSFFVEFHAAAVPSWTSI